jgi:pyruvate kinase
MRRTKIVATLGPSTEDRESIKAVLAAGADVVRLNGAHGTPAAHARAAELARDAAQELGRNLGVLVDLPGSKLRIGKVPGDELELEAGQTLVLTAAGEPAQERALATNVPDLPELVSVDDPIWLADGEIVLATKALGAGAVVTEVVRGGTLRSRKGLAVPGGDRVLDAFSSGDEKILELALRVGAELLGVSFVRSEDDLTRVHSALGGASSRPLLVAKIETPAALDHLDEIIAAADAVMIARGDLGVQIDIARTPLVQKEIIGLCNRAGRPVITATQMLDSMTRSPLPTRAEATDVANAVLDGTDALMLSEETGVGSFPVETVAMMARLASAAEAWRPDAVTRGGVAEDELVAAAVAHAAVQAAHDAGAAAIVCRTTTGATARRIASLRPRVPIVAVTPSDAVAAGLAVVWGVVGVVSPGADPDPVATVAAARTAGAVAADELVAVAASPPPGVADRGGSVHVVEA